MKWFTVVASVTLTFLGVAAPTQAAVIFGFSAVPQTGSELPPAPGSVVKYDIYLTETLTMGSPELANAQGGLYGGAFYVDVQSGAGTVITAVEANLAQFGTQPGSYKNTTPTQARLLQTAAGSNVLFSQVDSTHYRLLLGTVTMMADTGSTTFQVRPYKYAPQGTFGGSGVNGNNVVTDSAFTVFIDLDDDNNQELGGGFEYTGTDHAPFATFQVNVQQVPEPTSLALGAFAAAGIAFRAWRRRRSVVA